MTLNAAILKNQGQRIPGWLWKSYPEEQRSLQSNKSLWQPTGANEVEKENISFILSVYSILFYNILS
jgi:hypothetical protein